MEESTREGRQNRHDGKPANRACLGGQRNGSSVKRCTAAGELSVLQHQGHLGDFLLQLVAFFPELAQLVATNSDVQGLWSGCR